MTDDVLRQLLAMVRAELPHVPDDIWVGIEAALRGEYGGQRHYIAAHRKRANLQQIEAHPDYTPEQLARLMGVTPSRVRQLRRLSGK